MSYTRVRDGYATVTKSMQDGRLYFHGLPVLGFDPKTQTHCERKLLVSRHAPKWFVELCESYAGMDIEIRVKVVALYHGQVAFMGPYHGNLNAAVQDLSERNKGKGKSILTTTDMHREEAIEIHTACAKEHGLTVVRHKEDGKTVVTYAVDAAAVEYKISGGSIVGKLKERIQQGLSTKEKEIARFVRIRPAI